jgi:transcriptional accessory protein Tex/SPT6
VELIAIGNGTASRETDRLCAEPALPQELFTLEPGFAIP